MPKLKLIASLVACVMFMGVTAAQAAPGVQKTKHKAPTVSVQKSAKPKTQRQPAKPPETKPVFQFGVMFASAVPSNAVAEAKRWIGTNPTGWKSLWCAHFMNFVLGRSGYETTGSDAASSFANYGQRIYAPQVGAIAVMTRGKNGGHVGIVSKVLDDGNVMLVSGNHNKVVAEAPYPRSRVYAWVLPKSKS